MSSKPSEEQLDQMNQAFKLFTNPEYVLEFKKRYNIHTKQITDGHHSFEDLYDHRRKLSAIIFTLAREYAWKSKQHEDGTMFDGDFIVGVSIPNVGDYSYHYKLTFWDEFDVPIVAKAPKYDGHQPEDIDRLLNLIPILNK